MFSSQKGEGNIRAQYYTEIKKRLPVRRLPTIYLHYTWLCEPSICILKAFVLFCVWRSRIVTQFEGHVWWRNLTQKLYLFVGCHPHCVLCSCECVFLCMIGVFWRTNVFIGVKVYAFKLSRVSERKYESLSCSFICSTSRLFTVFRMIICNCCWMIVTEGIFPPRNCMLSFWRFPFSSTKYFLHLRL